uniref:Uncharacterized protein n=1 Tax=Nicotiana tabacum TaxID=4097 RepID=A0A1S4C576_TOBAC|nr:PREDICTED: uncharacterized protein LOC107815307 [Nicotiana tabacum]
MDIIIWIRNYAFMLKYVMLSTWLLIYTTMFVTSAPEFCTLIVDYAPRNLFVEIPTSRLFMQVNDKDLAKELCKKYSAIHRRKVRAWQMICILSRFIDQDIVQQVTHNLHVSLYRNNFPSVRQYLETFAIHVYLNFPLLMFLLSASKEN